MYLVPVKSKGKISQNFVAFSEYMNFVKSGLDTMPLFLLAEKLQNWLTMNQDLLETLPMPVHCMGFWEFQNLLECLGQP